MTDLPVVFAGLMPHAPILVPGVGGDRRSEAASTSAAMTEVARRAVAARPDAVVLISPHSPRQPGAFGIWWTKSLRGSLEEFGSPRDAIELPIDRGLAECIEVEARRLGVSTWRIAEGFLDHGAVVPLCYLAGAGWSGPTVVLGLDGGPSSPANLGRALAAAARSLHRRISIVASGDMSHRLTPSAPCGFHPAGRRFDDTFIALLRTGAGDAVLHLDPRLQESAAEDVVDATAAACAAAEGRADGRSVLSYEGPWGVGYGVAVLFDPGNAGPAPAALDRLQELPAIARHAVESELRGGPASPPLRAAGALLERRGVFVTIRGDTGELRGCIGTLAPRRSDLVWETWSNAVSAAFHDYRFTPLSPAELPHVRFAVSVLDTPESIRRTQDLDPVRYGVIVTAGDGRDGVLLPGIASITSPDQQVAIARRKAGIEPGEPVTLKRFEVTSVHESGFVEADD